VLPWRCRLRAPPALLPAFQWRFFAPVGSPNESGALVDGHRKHTRACLKPSMAARAILFSSAAVANDPAGSAISRSSGRTPALRHKTSRPIPVRRGLRGRTSRRTHKCPNRVDFIDALASWHRQPSRPHPCKAQSREPASHDRLSDRHRRHAKRRDRKRDLCANGLATEALPKAGATTPQPKRRKPCWATLRFCQYPEPQAGYLPAGAMAPVRRASPRRPTMRLTALQGGVLDRR
jgi:hypothetical protein